MERTELIKALLSLEVETGSFACLGCGYEHSCSTRGCAIIREVREALQKQNVDNWIRCTDALPEDPCDLVLVIANGWAAAHIPLVNSQQLAVYSPDEGWMLEEYPEAEDITVDFWTPIPQPPAGL